MLYNPEHKAMKKVLLKKIEQLVIKSNKMPEQRSPEWLTFRKTGFGGSEIASLLGQSCWTKGDDLIRNKTGITPRVFRGNLYTRWGTIMENITQRLTELILNTTVEELNILKGNIDGQIYSPDGVALVQLKCDFLEEDESKEQGLLEKVNKNLLKKIKIKKKSNLEYFFSLLEFKAPFSRIPSHKIPREYMAQMQYGMSTIKDVDNCLFVNALYRLCSLKDLGLNKKYNTMFHNRDKGKYSPLPRPIAVGIMVIYQSLHDSASFDEFVADCEDESDSDGECTYESDSDGECTYDSDSEDGEGYDMSMLETDQIIRCLPEGCNSLDPTIKRENELDFGSAGFRTVSRVFELLTESGRHKKNNPYISKIQVKYLEPYVVDEYKWRIDFMYNQDVPIPARIDENLINGKINKHMLTHMNKARHELSGNNEILGVLPYKMFDCDIIVANRDPDFEDLVKTKLERGMRIVREVNEAPMDKKESILAKYYPSKDSKSDKL